MLPCSWKEHFGVECPGCGAQRSFLELIQGHLLESIVLFPALLPLIAAITIAIIHLIKPFKAAPKWIVRLMLLTGLLMVGNWVFKLID